MLIIIGLYLFIVSLVLITYINDEIDWVDVVILAYLIVVIPMGYWVLFHSHWIRG